MPSISDKNAHGLHLDKTSKVNKPLIYREALRKVEEETVRKVRILRNSTHPFRVN